MPVGKSFLVFACGEREEDIDHHPTTFSKLKEFNCGILDIEISYFNSIPMIVELPHYYFVVLVLKEDAIFINWDRFRDC